MIEVAPSIQLTPDEKELHSWLVEVLPDLLTDLSRKGNTVRSRQAWSSKTWSPEALAALLESAKTTVEGWSEMEIMKFDLTIHQAANGFVRVSGYFFVA